ncbi:glycosyltransferase family 4 protein [Janthinobacterium sp. BJB304]|uniref:glycosyltransferase family 4 protein n=1 Tax=Janthinobacterium sp. BJB304 TaxID=1572871 RepID=UPI000C113EBD|nr:glycosyltransferase family 4 protein [Janthinobacterium sp. BJB304]PHV35993.1 glycosyl transferase family 1 [Janthinobacterium sp. BJB304]
MNRLIDRNSDSAISMPIPASAGKPSWKVLVIHQNFPGQFRNLVLDLARDPDCQVLAVGKQGCPGMSGVRTYTYKLHRRPAPGTHHYVKPFEAGILHGQAVLRLLLALKNKGFSPDVIVAHPGWGETLFVEDVFPQARLIHFSEYYYHAAGADAGFDPEFPASLDDIARIRSKNALMLLNLENCDVAVAPTPWQKSLHPLPYQEKIVLLHEGVDTDYLQPDPSANFVLPNGKILQPGDEVLTYVARNLEPYRGFHTFMRAVPDILRQRPDCHIVIVGGDDVSYGSKPKDVPNWREKMLLEVTFDVGRVHFLGRIPYPAYRSLLQVSAVHVYLTYPFVLSWSMLEAMACGCLLIASDTAPVRDVVRNGENGLLTDFFDASALARKVVAVLREPSRFEKIRRAGVLTVRRDYPTKRGTAGYRQLIGIDKNDVVASSSHVI